MSKKFEIPEESLLAHAIHDLILDELFRFAIADRVESEKLVDKILDETISHLTEHNPCG